MDLLRLENGQIDEVARHIADNQKQSAKTQKAINFFVDGLIERCGSDHRPSRW